MVRHSLNYVTSRDRKEVAGDLKLIYQSTTAEQAAMQLDTFAGKWDKIHPTISRSWRRNWEQIIPFFSYPPGRSSLALGNSFSYIFEFWRREPLVSQS